MMRRSSVVAAVLTLGLMGRAQQPLTAPPVKSPVGAMHGIAERQVAFVSEGLSFPAILTLPKGQQGKRPLVVMLGGSGPQDADEAIGPNKPFRDIAAALGERGIATLRYPKRSRLAPQTMAGEHTDLDWEYTRDALAALTFASQLEESDPELAGGAIYLLGHSLGASMAPRIAAARLAQKAGSVAGVILLAPGVLPIDRTLKRQILAQQARAGASPAQMIAVIEAVDAMIGTMKSAGTPPDALVGIGALQLPERYWREWLSLAPAAELKRLNLPSLVLRGSADVQVVHEDYEAIVPAQSGSDSRHAELPGLDHFFFAVRGASTGVEYMQPNRVAAAATAAIADWMLAGQVPEARPGAPSF